MAIAQSGKWIFANWIIGRSEVRPLRKFPTERVVIRSSQQDAARIQLISRFLVNLKPTRKRMGSGDPSGLQNQRELVNPALVGSTPTRFRQLSFQWLRGVPDLCCRFSDWMAAHNKAQIKPDKLSKLSPGRLDSHSPRWPAKPHPGEFFRRCIPLTGSSTSETR